jgi:hypothetical protein
MCACSCISSKRYAQCKHNIDIPYTVKKEKEIFLIFQKVSGAKLYILNMTITAASYMTKYLRISSYIRKPFLIYDFAPIPSEFSYI